MRWVYVDFYIEVASFNADHQPSRRPAKQAAHKTSRCKSPRTAARAPGNPNPAPPTHDDKANPATRADTVVEQTPHR